MRMRGGATALIAVLLVALAGCVPTTPEPTPTSDPTPTGVFASEDEALAAAEEAYAEYLRVSDEIAQDGGADPERIEVAVVANRYEAELQSYRAFQGTGQSQIGATTAAPLEVASVDLDTGEIVAHTCLDFSGTRFVDSTGLDVTPADRPAVAAVEIKLELSDGGRLLVAGSEPWSDLNYCS